jgi:hypothetical protein
MEREHREEPALAPASELELPTTNQKLERPENLDVQTPSCLA